ncbi:HTH-type transcriptional regulator PuuR [Vibrio fluvialis]|jgi:HTH-type transcriptional repressor of puuD|uniref:XRE family transcriptional regulator n=3 Tax=Vibrio TaxID=662 RepID=A0A0Q2SBN0_VIBFU|nr:MULTISPECIES: HTH-type transcriptional regulator PuuR [Vibrio]TNF14948.1 MAG: HTH-type transcriptional regulator PuuR [Vibrionaceae bacterium]HDM8036624.1 HTH-type transcriptional regulator PuuR [Vibrio fluvialis clinical-1]AMF94681.1 helix-turn-helix domain-containing protein [Vibrio fluvialis]AVH30624.1 helix-turn-helix domain-containing protein [Vibrio fluvialis]EKO3371534.1 HTH-type transcriptional regulator PuuR [Vibrio fluvialis]
METDSIGQKIAQLRKEHKLSQRELAEKANITHSAISSIENNKVSPSVSSLHKIVKVFNLSLSEFFTQDQTIEERPVVIAPDQLIEIGNERVSMRLVCDGRDKRRMGFLIECFQPHTDTGVISIKHEGEESGTVLEGEIELTLGDKTYVIREGECYLFDTNVPHKFTNKTDRVCRIISAHTPPSF